MSKKIVLLSAVLMAAGAVLMFLGRNNAEAKVCFINDPTCGGNAIDQYTPNDSSCISAGYTCSGTTFVGTNNPCFGTVYYNGQPSPNLPSWLDTSSCTTTDNCWKEMKCPLNTDYYALCPKAFKQSCPAPYEVDGTCGTLKGCKCPDTHIYTSDLFTSNNPNNIKTNSPVTESNVLHCMATGGACSDINAQGLTDTDPLHQRYPACICTAPYLYSQSDNTNAHATPYRGSTGMEYCVDNSGVEHYMGWHCEEAWYNQTAATCEPYGVDSSDQCFDMGLYAWRYHSCLNCDDYPADDLKYVTSSLSLPTGAPSVSGCINSNGAECMRNNFDYNSTNKTWALKTQEETEEGVDGTVTYGPYARYFGTESGQVDWSQGMNRHYDINLPKYAYITCPYSQNTSAPRHYIVACTEPGMRPSTTGDIKYNDDGTPMMVEYIDPQTGLGILNPDGTPRMVEVHYKNGEACVPVSCEDAVKFILRSGDKFAADGSNKPMQDFMNSYGLLLSTPIKGYKFGVGAVDMNLEVESYSFVDGEGRPIVEQFINGKAGGFLRTLIDTSLPVTALKVIGDSPAGNYGYGYQTSYEGMPSGKEIFTDIETINTYLNDRGEKRRYTHRRKAIVIDDVNFSKQGGIHNQPRPTCVRRPCYARNNPNDPNEPKQYWTSTLWRDINTNPNLHNGVSQSPSLCYCKWNPTTSTYSDASNIGFCKSDTSSSSLGKFVRQCNKTFLDGTEEVYWEKAEHPILGNRDNTEHTACGDVDSTGEYCITCFAKGYLANDYFTATCSIGSNLDWNEVPSYVPVPTKDNNCLASHSDGPVENPNPYRVRNNYSGTLYGRYPIPSISGQPTQYNNPNIKLQDWDNDPDCVQTEDKEENRVVAAVGLGGAPVDEYISVAEFYEELTNADLGSSAPSHKAVFKHMLERSCKVGKAAYQKPKINYTGAKFPADDDNYYRGDLPNNGGVGKNPNAAADDIPVMSFKGIDIEISGDTKITRQLEFDDVDLKVNGKLTMEPNVTTDGFVSTIQNSTIIASTYTNQGKISIASSTILAATFENNAGNNTDATITNTDIGICTFTNAQKMTLVSSDGSHVVKKASDVAELHEIEYNSSPYCVANFENTGDFTSDKYKFVLSNFKSTAGNTNNNNSCLSGAKISGQGANDIQVSNMLTLSGRAFFSNAKINTLKAKIGEENNPSIVETINVGENTQAAIVQLMNGSSLTVDGSGYSFEIFAPSMIGNSNQITIYLPGSQQYKYLLARMRTNTAISECHFDASSLKTICHIANVDCPDFYKYAFSSGMGPQVNPTVSGCNKQTNPVMCGQTEPIGDTCAANPQTCPVNEFKYGYLRKYKYGSDGRWHKHDLYSNSALAPTGLYYDNETVLNMDGNDY